jgi:hypothetical protein
VPLIGCRSYPAAKLHAPSPHQCGLNPSPPTPQASVVCPASPTSAASPTSPISVYFLAIPFTIFATLTTLTIHTFLTIHATGHWLVLRLLLQVERPHTASLPLALSLRKPGYLSDAVGRLLLRSAVDLHRTLFRSRRLRLLLQVARLHAASLPLALSLRRSGCLGDAVGRLLPRFALDLHRALFAAAVAGCAPPHCVIAPRPEPEKAWLFDLIIKIFGTNNLDI